MAGLSLVANKTMKSQFSIRCPVLRKSCSRSTNNPVKCYFKCRKQRSITHWWSRRSCNHARGCARSEVPAQHPLLLSGSVREPSADSGHTHDMKCLNDDSQWSIFQKWLDAHPELEYVEFYATLLDLLIGTLPSAKRLTATGIDETSTSPPSCSPLLWTQTILKVFHGNSKVENSYCGGNVNSVPISADLLERKVGAYCSRTTKILN